MEAVQSGMQKHDNYREQMSRLTRALKADFYIEAISIEYAVIEDRLSSVLRHSGKFNPEKHKTLQKKLDRLKEMQRAKTGSPVLVGKYISYELILLVEAWKEQRNRIVHRLMDCSFATDELKELAQEGRRVAKTLNSKVSSYNRAIDRLNAV